MNVIRPLFPGNVAAAGAADSVAQAMTGRNAMRPAVADRASFFMVPPPKGDPVNLGSSEQRGIVANPRCRGADSVAAAVLRDARDG
jgi:hypothetical protein